MTRFRLGHATPPREKRTHCPLSAVVTASVCLALGGVFSGCAAKQADTAPKAPASTPPPAQRMPHHPEFTYVSGSAKKDGERAESGEHAEGSSSADAQPSTHAVRTASAARELAEQALANQPEGESVYLSPAVTTTWPPVRAQLLFVAYPLKPAPHQMDVYEAGRPFAVHVDLSSGEAKIERLESGDLAAIRQERETRAVRESRAQAEQALVELLIGERPIENAMGPLRGYRTWLDDHRDLSDDLEGRYPDALKWLIAPEIAEGGFQMVPAPSD